jgi:hypothetical protein
MASEILGLFTSPEEYQLRQQQAQQQGQQNAALQFAKLNPFEKASYGIYQGAQQLGGAGARLFGGEDPQLRIISQRQMLTKDIDPSNPQSILEAAKAAAELPGQQDFAFALADYARKAQSEIDLARQRFAGAERETKQAIPAEIALASAKGNLDLTINRLSKMEQTPQIIEALDTAKTLRAAYDKEGPTTNEMKNADAFALRKGPRGSDAYNAEFDSRLEKLTSKADKVTAYGVDRNAIAKGEFGKDFADLDQSQQKTVNKLVADENKKIAEAGAIKLPGQGKEGPKGISEFRGSVIETIKPFRNTVTSADQAIQSINDSLKTGNFISFNAARTQLAKALGDGTLSRRDVEQAGGDPSILGGLADTASTMFTGTPTADTQRKIKSTLMAIRKVAKEKGASELAIQRQIAQQSGYDENQMKVIFTFPEFEKKAGGTQPITNETIPENLAPKTTAPVKGQKQTRKLKSGKTVTVETE